MSSAKCCPFRLGLNVWSGLNDIVSSPDIQGGLREPVSMDSLFAFVKVIKESPCGFQTEFTVSLAIAYIAD